MKAGIFRLPQKHLFRIAIVDDVADNRFILRSLLERYYSIKELLDCIHRYAGRSSSLAA